MAARRLAVLTVLALTLSLSACGSDAPKDDKKPTAADVRANRTILEADGLPGGWRRVPAKDRLDGPPGTARYCGVVAEPDPVREGRISYYEQASLPRSVLEYGMLSTVDGASATMAALVERKDDCAEPGAKVTPVPVSVGDESVAWDFAREGGPSFRTVVFRRADVVVVLVATGDTSVPGDEQLEIARAIDDRLR
jgi:hypothetical protein